MKLREIGLEPDMIFCRTSNEISKSVKDKISLFCSVSPSHVIEASDVKSIYEVPLLFHKQNVEDLILNDLKFKTNKSNINELEKFIYRFKNPQESVDIALCGKYTELPDAYKSVLEAFIHSGVENNAKVSIKWINTEKLESSDSLKNELDNIHGIMVLPGFGDRGIKGKIEAAKYSRKFKVPYFGICLGLQIAVIEFAKNVCGIKDAYSSEFKDTTNSVIDLMLNQKNINKKGATMRLGAYDCNLKMNSLAYKAYNSEKILERHRHRYEVNNNYRKVLESNGMIFSGINEKLDLVEIIELENHPWFLGCQFHPELKSRVNKAHPLFKDFVKSSINYKKNNVK